MDIGGVTDGDMVAQDARMVVGEVQDGVVLDVGAAANFNAINVTPQHGPIPDSGFVTECDIAHHHGGICEEDL